MTKPKLLIDADDACDDLPYQPVARNRRAEQERFTKRTLMTRPVFRKIIDGFENFKACWWALSNGYTTDFWEWLSMGWYDEYIYPYDDPCGVI